MNSAQSIVNRTAGACAVTYEGGYAVFADGSRVLFEPAHILRKCISLSGRCTALDCQYANGYTTAQGWAKQTMHCDAVKWV